MSDIIKSPITLSKNVKLEKQINAQAIIDIYKKSLNLDVRAYYCDTDTISIYQCIDTGYKFYYPFNLTGDTKFYETLQQFDWYYIIWKWEHELARKFINIKSKVLEIGCGEGNFLKDLNQSKMVDCAGLEINEKAIKVAKYHGLEILNETIQQHAQKNTEIYDTVCAFQVLEHIPYAGSFLKSSLAALKKGGNLIISVPNNDSFIKYDKENILNMPPHHMRLWNKTALSNLQKFFPLKLIGIYMEPLQPYHYKYYYNTQMFRLIKKTGLLGKMVYLITHHFYEKLIGKLSNWITGHTIVVVFVKQ
ncbi:MAG: class I SAM-dependent methyltransferase [Cytophagales bacterium]|nr:class I SAM-dependent methyltransferase [Cytophagales bacterium]